MNKLSIRKALLTAVAGIALTGINLASAETSEGLSVELNRDGLSAVAVSYADLDLGTAEGNQALQARLRKAATQVCGPTDRRSAGSPAFAQRNKACVNAALADALRQLSASLVASN